MAFTRHARLLDVLLVVSSRIFAAEAESSTPYNFLPAHALTKFARTSGGHWETQVQKPMPVTSGLVPPLFAKVAAQAASDAAETMLKAKMSELSLAGPTPEDIPPATSFVLAKLPEVRVVRDNDSALSIFDISSQRGMQEPRVSKAATNSSKIENRAEALAAIGPIASSPKAAVALQVSEILASEPFAESSAPLAAKEGKQQHLLADVIKGFLNKKRESEMTSQTKRRVLARKTRTLASQTRRLYRVNDDETRKDQHEKQMLSSQALSDELTSSETTESDSALSSEKKRPVSPESAMDLTQRFEPPRFDLDPALVKKGDDEAFEQMADSLSKALRKRGSTAPSLISQFDTDNDKLLNLSDFSRAVAEVTRAHAPEHVMRGVFDLLDSNSDGALELREVTAALLYEQAIEPPKSKQAHLELAPDGKRTLRRQKRH